MRLAFLLLVSVALEVDAATLNKCIDANGQITFTHTSCPSGGSIESIEVGRGGAGMLLGPARPDEEVAEEAKPTKDMVTVVGGGSEATACSRVPEQDMRTAIVRNQISVGMTDTQVVQSWGKPNEINRSSHGDQWVYYRGPVDMQFVYVDPAGCVTGWN